MIGFLSAVAASGVSAFAARYFGAPDWGVYLAALVAFYGAATTRLGRSS